MLDENQLATIQREYEGWLQEQPGFHGVGLSVNNEGNKCLKIYMNQMPEEVRNTIAERIKSTPIQFEEIGTTKKL